MKETEVMTEVTETTGTAETTDTIPAGSADNTAASADNTAGSAPNESAESIAEALRELNRHAENIEGMLSRIILDLEQPWRR